MSLRRLTDADLPWGACDRDHRMSRYWDNVRDEYLCSACARHHPDYAAQIAAEEPRK